jgi:DNA-binding XRE family transcriptional regulator
MFATILKRDRIRNGMTQAQAARRLSVPLADYRAVEAEELLKDHPEPVSKISGAVANLR